MKTSTSLTVCLALLSGCGSDASGAKEAAPDLRVTVSPAYRDSLVLTGPEGEEVWFTSGREAEGADGQPCVERSLQIRSPVDTLAVPLLYTGGVPTLVDDSTFRVDLWGNCAPTRAYLVNLRTGRPTVVP